MSGLLQTIEQVFTAGQSLSWATSARNFRLLAGSAVDIRFFFNGAIVGEAEQVDSGFYLKSPDVFDRVQIDSAAGQTVKFTIGAAEAGTADAVSITSMPAVAVASVPTNGGAVSHGWAVAGASAQVLAANPARKFLVLQNIGSGDVHFTLDGTAAAVTTHKLLPGASATFDFFVPTGAVMVYSAFSMVAWTEG